MKAIHAKRIFDGLSFVQDAVLIWDGDRISVVGSKDILSKYQITELFETDCDLVPGFVDIQVNGAGGADFYGDGISTATLKVMSQTLQRYGCTSFCPTLITSSDEDIRRALELVNTDNSLEKLGVLGLHIEGPMFSQEHKGAHNPDLIRVLSQELIDAICQSNVKIVSLSPEVAHLEYIEKLSRSGIRVSVAHTNASFEEVRTAEQFGSTMGTHLYNGMSRFFSRDPNAVGALLTSKKSFSSIIPDGNHCDYNSVIIAHKCLGDRLITITDAIVAMGTSMRKFKLGFQDVHIDEKNRCLGDYGGLAGSIITPIECLQNLVNFCEFSLTEALISYTSGPARALGLEYSIGFLKSKNYADFVLLDESLNISAVYAKGRKIAF